MNTQQRCNISTLPSCETKSREKVTVVWRYEKHKVKYAKKQGKVTLEKIRGGRCAFVVAEGKIWRRRRGTEKWQLLKIIGFQRFAVRSSSMWFVRASKLLILWRYDEARGRTKIRWRTFRGSAPALWQVSSRICCKQREKQQTWQSRLARGRWRWARKRVEIRCHYFRISCKSQQLSQIRAQNVASEISSLWRSEYENCYKAVDFNLSRSRGDDSCYDWQAWTLVMLPFLSVSLRSVLLSLVVSGNLSTLWLKGLRRIAAINDPNKLIIIIVIGCRTCHKIGKHATRITQFD